MPRFKYACFISYCHGQHELVKGFVDQLKTALKAELDALIDEDVYIDQERLKPGYAYNEELAQAICQSVCMLVVYMPKYERHDYCLREFEGMRLLAQKRRAILGVDNDTRDFIIPVVLRGDDDIPERIKSNTHYANFAKFSLAMPDILRNAEFVAEVKKIAGVVYEWYRAFEEVPADPCAPCAAFKLPAAGEVAPWRPPFVNR